MAQRAHVAHHMRGRMRLKLPAAKDDQALLARIKQSLSPLPGIRHVSVNPTTGSVVVDYDADHHRDFHGFMERHGERRHLFSIGPPPVSMADDVETRIEREAEFLAGHSHPAHRIVGFFRRVNRELRVATDNTVRCSRLLVECSGGRVLFPRLERRRVRATAPDSDAAGHRVPHLVVVFDNGINDSPALSEADVGVAMKDASELASATADVVLMRGNLWQLIAAIDISQSTMRRIRESYSVILAFNAIAFPPSIPVGLVAPATVAAISNGSALVAILNAARPTA